VDGRRADDFARHCSCRTSGYQRKPQAGRPRGEDQGKRFCPPALHSELSTFLFLCFGQLFVSRSFSRLLAQVNDRTHRCRARISGIQTTRTRGIRCSVLVGCLIAQTAQAANAISPGPVSNETQNKW
jgi:hypothetical protein